MGIGCQSRRVDKRGFFRRAERENWLASLGIPHPNGNVSIEIFSKTPSSLQVVARHLDQHRRTNGRFRDWSAESDQAAPSNRLQFRVGPRKNCRSHKKGNGFTCSNARKGLDRLALQVRIASVQRGQQRTDCRSTKLAQGRPYHFVLARSSWIGQGRNQHADRNASACEQPLDRSHTSTVRIGGELADQIVQSARILYHSLRGQEDSVGQLLAFGSQFRAHGQVNEQGSSKFLFQREKLRLIQIGRQDL